jgi:oligopeptide/dipeptide ABC transporter ATP-binding protein
MSETALSVRDLSVAFPAPGGLARVVNSVSLELQAGEVMGLVGESGCGKSVMALAVMGLLGGTGATVEAQALRLGANGRPQPPSAGFRAVRGREIAMIFQEPSSALDPVFTVGWQIASMLRRQLGLNRQQARQAALQALASGGFPDAPEIYHAYPGQLSGGMRQLVMIAMAMAVRPRVLIADEPTTALDVTTQQLVIDQLLKLRDAAGTAILLITHDLGVVASCCSRIAVMYCGRIVEQAPYAGFHARPRHPYSSGLLDAVPRVTSDAGVARGIAGQVPAPDQLPPGCAFAPRCSRATQTCTDQLPGLQSAADGQVACHHPL